MSTAAVTLDSLADLAAANLQPEGRAAAIAASLRQIAEIGGDLALTAADCVVGFTALAQPKSEDEHGRVTSRRRTCGELASLTDDAEGGDSSRLAAVLRAIESRFAGSDDPRQKSMADTAAREASELGG